jgi:hypothetical protein
MFDFGIASVRPRAPFVWVVRMDDERLVFYCTRRGKRLGFHELPCGSR